MKFTQRLILILAASACVLAAQDDPPSRIARLSYIYGSVSFRPGDVDDWYPAFVNRPLTTGDHVYVDFAGTGELEFGAGTLRLGSKTTMDILNLDDGNTQLRLSEGTLLIRLRSFGDQDSFEIDTPNLAFSLLRTGIYRIDVKPDRGTTTVTVRGGDAELNGPDQAFTVHAGEQVLVTGADQPNYQTLGLPPPDTLDNFAAERDQREDQSASARYCSREMVGYQDLDKYGAWRDTPDYGSVWVPNAMPAGWAPYHDGHWAWVDPWGWTWVDDAPWGFAPFHYGRWAYVGNTWGWIPGPRAERPVYAPALVAWVGGGSIGAGVAWFPLGPREVYVPTYHTTPAYMTRVNVSNTVIQNNINITNVNVTNVRYVNRTAPGGVTAVQRDAFTSARPVQSAAIAVRPEQLQTATVTTTASIAPTRASLVRPRDAAVRVAQPTAAVLNQPVIAKHAPPPPPVPFAQKQAALANNGGKPLERSQMLSLRPTPTAQPQIRQVQARPVQARPVQAQPLQQQTAPAAQQPAQQPRNLQQQPPPPVNPQRQPAPVAQPAPGAQPAPQSPAPLTRDERREQRDERKAAPQDRTPPPPQERTPPPPQRTSTPPPPPPAATPAPAARPVAPPPAAARPAPKENNRTKREDRTDKKEKKDEQK